MPAPTEHKTVQARILACAQEIGWIHVSREEAERRRGFEPLISRMNTDMKKLAGMHSLREWGRLKTKTLQAGLSDLCFFLPIPDSWDHRCQSEKFNSLRSPLRGGLWHSVSLHSTVVNFLPTALRPWLA